jgi:DNA-binding response OmpR family regulator
VGIHTLLIAERNPHVREFLKRELGAEGYRVRLAESGKQLLHMVTTVPEVDLVIVDPDLPDWEETRLAENLRDHTPVLPVIIHGFWSEQVESFVDTRDAAFVEKAGSSVERLRWVVRELLLQT